MLRVDLVGLVAAGHSGVPRYAAALTNALDAVAPEFQDLSMRLLTTEQGLRESRPRSIPVELVSGALGGANAGAGRILAEQLAARRADTDLLHFFDLTGPVLSPRRPFVTTMHDAAIRHKFERVRTAHKQFLQPWALRHARAVVAVSGFARDEAVRLMKADASRIEVIHSGPGLIGGNGVPSPPSRDGVDPYVLYVGNLAAHKNLPFLIGAFGTAAVDARLLLVGRRGERFDEISEAAAASPARERIEIRRDVTDSEVDALYRGASLLVLPSRYEGFGFTALEAMARGCPVLASDIPALREVSGDGAMLVPPDDEGAWADSIRRLLADEGDRTALAERGRRVAGRYSWETTARSVCRMFLRVGAAI